MSKTIRELADLTPDKTNANKGTVRGRSMVEASLRETGAGRSILADREGRIIAGNKTLEAWADIGGEIEIVRTDGKKLVVVQRDDLDLSDDTGTARKLAYYDNRAGQVGLEWDAEQLLADINAGVDLSSLFRDDELDELLADLQPKPEPTDDAPAQVDKADELRQKWGTSLGQLWQLGEHRLICGDCTDAAVVARVMGGEKAQMMVTDPPYNVAYEGNYIQSGKILESAEKIWLGGIDNDDLPDFPVWLAGVYGVMDGFLEDGCAIYIWHPPGAECRHFWTAWLWDRWHFQVDLVWNKTSLIISRWDYKPQHEPMMYGWKGKNRKWAGPNNEPTVWDIARQQGNSGEERFHPTQKPTELFVRAIRNHGGDIVIEPFSGSGTTIIACEQLGRKARAIEISAGYVAVALDRWATATGQTPVLIS